MRPLRPHLRLARPVGDLALARECYVRGLGLQVIGEFADHEGFDGVMLGLPGADWHLEFTHARAHPLVPQPTVEDLLVLYLPDGPAWQQACSDMLAAGFKPVTSFNPYWEARGRSFEDADGYRVVLQNAAWGDDGSP